MLAMVEFSGREKDRHSHTTEFCDNSKKPFVSLSLSLSLSLSTVQPGSLLIDSSTIAPDEARAVAQLCKESSAEFIDAPVSGGSIFVVKHQSSVSYTYLVVLFCRCGSSKERNIVVPGGRS